MQWQAALHIVMHLKATSSCGITFQREMGRKLEFYVDADYAHKTNDRRSVSGGVVMCAGAHVSFYARTQKCVTLCSTEAEYVAMATGFRESIFMQYIWSCNFPDREVGRTTVKEDNKGAIHLARKPVTTHNLSLIHI